MRLMMLLVISLMMVLMFLLTVKHQPLPKQVHQLQQIIQDQYTLALHTMCGMVTEQN